MVEALRCCIHDVVEEITESSFRRCLECWHVYQTEAELADLYNEERQAHGAVLNGLPSRVPIDQIFFCPLCLHDF